MWKWTNVMKMNKGLRILEVPVLLLIIAIASWERDLLMLTLFLVIISILRLIVNVITDESIYKR